MYEKKMHLYYAFVTSQYTYKAQRAYTGLCAVESEHILGHNGIIKANVPWIIQWNVYVCLQQHHTWSCVSQTAFLIPLGKFYEVRRSSLGMGCRPFVPLLELQLKENVALFNSIS